MGMELEQDPTSRGLTDEGIIHIPGLSSRWVRLANGAKAHYVTAGEDGPAVILLHGGIEGSSGTAGFRFMCNFLGANGFRVYAPDRPGYGLSDTREGYLDRSPKAQVEFISMFADALCIDKFHLSGNSMGAMMAVFYAVTNPDRLLSVAYIAGHLGDIEDKPRVPPKDGKFTPNPDYAYPGFDGTEASMRALMDSIIYEAKAIWPELITMRVLAAAKQREARKTETGAQRTRGLMELDEDQAVALRTRGRLDKLKTPMICLYGLQDVLIPVENGFDQEDVVPNIQYFYPDECGHQGQTDQPEMFNEVLREFFSTGKVSWKNAMWAGVSRRRAINPELVEEPAGGFPAPIPEAYADLQTLRAALQK